MGLEDKEGHMPSGIFLDLSECIAVRSSCYCAACYPFLPLSRIHGIIDFPREVGEDCYRLFLVSLTEGGEISLVTSHLEGLRFVGGRAL